MEKISFSKLGQGKTEEEKAAIKRRWLEEKRQTTCKHIGHFSFDPQQVAGRNCENMIGATQIPLGAAGPITIKTLKQETKEYYVPLATTEGALVASVSRGCKAISLSDGALVKVKQLGTSRAPVFKVRNLIEAEKLIHWTQENFEYLKEITEETDTYLLLKKIQPFLSGRFVFLRFIYDTHEAMGMNMVTIATKRAAEAIQKSLGIELLSLSGNMCVDKKPCWLNFILGRGKRVWAEAVIKKEVVKNALKTTPEKIKSVVLGKNMVGSQLSGSLGFNAHFSNIIAALFIATGQDPAHVVEGSLGTTSAEVEKNGDLYFSIYLPSLLLGTIGGGTGLATQQEALKILGLGNGTKGEALELARIVGGAVLAGELSLVSALAANHLAKAHEQLGRSQKK